MSQQMKSDNYIRRYLLGELSDEEQEQVERRMLSDGEFYQQVLIAEDDLIYDFVCDELQEQETTRFRQHVLPIPERREDVKFARVLRKYVRQNSPSLLKAQTSQRVRSSWLEPFAVLFRRPIIGVSLAAALLLALSISAWMAIDNRRLQNRIKQLESKGTPAPSPPQDLQEQLTAERKRSADLEDELRREQELRESAERNLEAAREQSQMASDNRPRTSVATVVSFLLIPGASRDSGDVNKIFISRGASEIRLQLDLAANSYRSYRAALKTVDGQKELVSRDGLRAHAGARGTAVSLTVPAIFLHRGDYQIKLSGETSAGKYEDVETYYFRVTE